MKRKIKQEKIKNNKFCFILGIAEKLMRNGLLRKEPEVQSCRGHKAGSKPLDSGMNRYKSEKTHKVSGTYKYV